jgi:hypothetical protein
MNSFSDDIHTEERSAVEYVLSPIFLGAIHTRKWLQFRGTIIDLHQHTSFV